MQQRNLCQLMGVKWSDHLSNFEILERAEMPSVEEITKKNQLRWTGHTTRMEDCRPQTKFFYGEIEQGLRKVRAPQLRYKDIFKGT